MPHFHTGDNPIAEPMPCYGYNFEIFLLQIVYCFFKVFGIITCVFHCPLHVRQRCPGGFRHQPSPYFLHTIGLQSL